MRNRLVHRIPLFLFILFFSGCRHEEQMDPNSSYCGEATTIDEMMEWVYFKTGTYWIYEEQNSGALDTMTVYYDYNGVSNTGNREFVMKMESSLDGYTYEYWFNDAWSGECSLFPGCFCRVVDCEKYMPGDYVGGNHNFIFPLKIGNKAGQLGPNLSSGASEIVSYQEELLPNDTTYFGVYTYRMDFSIQHDRKLAYYTICKKIGILEKAIPELDENWVLIEFIINQ